MGAEHFHRAEGPVGLFSFALQARLYGFPFREAELQTHRPQGDTTTLGAKGPVKLKNPPAHRAGPS